MATQNDTRAGTFVVATAIDQANLLVQLTATGVAPATAGTEAILGTSRQAAAVGEMTAIQYLTKEGTHICIAGGAVAVGDFVAPAAGGKVTSGLQAGSVGIAITAAGADGDQLEVMISHNA